MVVSLQLKQINKRNIMKKTITKNDFKREFKESNRENQFSRYALEKLFDSLEDYEESTGEEIELDVIALCCEYTEFESLEELKRNYNVPEDFEEAREYLEERTQVICFEEDCILIQNY